MLTQENAGRKPRCPRPCLRSRFLALEHRPWPGPIQMTLLIRSRRPLLSNTSSLSFGENRRFDHLFATYVPKRGNERVSNLLSKGIINADGSPGPNFAQANQFQIVSAPNGGKYFNSADLAQKQLYTHAAGARCKWRWP